MIIQNTKYIIHYPKIINLRRKAIEIEECLKDFFPLGANILPIPEEAPAELPRLNFVSRYGHSMLNVSLVNTQLLTNYDDKYNKDWSQCLDYLEKRIKSLNDLIRERLESEFLFSGLTTEVLFDEFSGDDPVKMFKDKFIKCESSQTPFELGFRATFEKEKCYFVNLNFANVRIYENLNAQTVPPSLFEAIEKHHWLGAMVDVNDKFGFNYSKNYNSGYEKTHEILKITNEFISGKLLKIIKEGRFDI